VGGIFTKSGGEVGLVVYASGVEFYRGGNTLAVNSNDYGEKMQCCLSFTLCPCIRLTTEKNRGKFQSAQPESAAHNSGCRPSRLFAAGLDRPADVRSPLFQDLRRRRSALVVHKYIPCCGNRGFPAPAYLI